MAMNNTTTKKSYGNVKDSARKAEAPQTVNSPNHSGKYAGEFGGQSAKFAKPMNSVTAAIGGVSGTHNDIGEMSGFINDGYMDKNGTPFGEGAKFNFLPPGMDISNQMNAEIHEMPLRTVVDISYPGDGWMPTPRDVSE